MPTIYGELGTLGGAQTVPRAEIRVATVARHLAADLEWESGRGVCYTDHQRVAEAGGGKYLQGRNGDARRKFYGAPAVDMRKVVSHVTTKHVVFCSHLHGNCFVGKSTADGLAGEAAQRAQLEAQLCERYRKAETEWKDCTRRAVRIYQLWHEERERAEAENEERPARGPRRRLESPVSWLRRSEHRVAVSRGGRWVCTQCLS